MKAFFSFVAALVLSLSMAAQNKSFYDFTVKTIDGKEYPLSGLKGKKVLVVNVASKCGLTPQYAELQELYDQYKDQNFVITAFLPMTSWTRAGDKRRDRQILFGEL